MSFLSNEDIATVELGMAYIHNLRNHGGGHRIDANMAKQWKRENQTLYYDMLVALLDDDDDGKLFCVFVSILPDDDIVKLCQQHTCHGKVLSSLLLFDYDSSRDSLYEQLATVVMTNYDNNYVHLDKVIEVSRLPTWLVDDNTPMICKTVLCTLVTKIDYQTGHNSNLHSLAVKLAQSTDKINVYVHMYHNAEGLFGNQPIVVFCDDTVIFQAILNNPHYTGIKDNTLFHYCFDKVQDEKVKLLLTAGYQPTDDDFGVLKTQMYVDHADDVRTVMNPKLLTIVKHLVELGHGVNLNILMSSLDPHHGANDGQLNYHDTHHVIALKLDIIKLVTLPSPLSHDGDSKSGGEQKPRNHYCLSDRQGNRDWYYQLLGSFINTHYYYQNQITLTKVNNSNNGDDDDGDDNGDGDGDNNGDDNDDDDGGYVGESGMNLDELNQTLNTSMDTYKCLFTYLSTGGCKFANSVLEDFF